MSNLFTPFSFTPLTTISPSCTYGSSSYAGSNVQYGIGSAIGLSFSSIAEANKNKQTAIDNAFASGNHWNLPKGSYSATQQHIIGSGCSKVVKGDGYIRYEWPDGRFTVHSDNGKIDSGTK
jgi:hypothetical protein